MFIGFDESEESDGLELLEESVGLKLLEESLSLFTNVCIEFVRFVIFVSFESLVV